MLVCSLSITPFSSKAHWRRLGKEGKSQKHISPQGIVHKCWTVVSGFTVFQEWDAIHKREWLQHKKATIHLYLVLNNHFKNRGRSLCWWPGNPAMTTKVCLQRSCFSPVFHSSIPSQSRLMKHIRFYFNQYSCQHGVHVSLTLYALKAYRHAMSIFFSFMCVTTLIMILKCSSPACSTVPERTLCRQWWRDEAAAALLISCFHYATCADTVPDSRKSWCQAVLANK